MTRWTSFQFAAMVVAGIALAGIQLFRTTLTSFLSSLPIRVQPAIIITFLTIIIVIWGFALLLFWQSKKGRSLFEHRIWRIMPVIAAGWLLLSIIGFLVLGMTVLSDIDAGMHWLLDLLIIYFLALFYFLILSIVIRYGKAQTETRTILVSAHTAVLTAIVILFFIPGL